jgi:hypothetical protein
MDVGMPMAWPLDEPVVLAYRFVFDESANEASEFL